MSKTSNPDFCRFVLTDEKIIPKNWGSNYTSNFFIWELGGQKTLLSTTDTGTEGHSGIGVFSTQNNLRQTFTELCCYSSFLAYMPVTPWSGVGWAPWFTLPALACLSSVLGTSCCSSRGGLGHSLDEDRLLKAVSAGDTSHKATYVLFYLLIAIQANKKK